MILSALNSLPAFVYVIYAVGAIAIFIPATRSAMEELRWDETLSEGEAVASVFFGLLVSFIWPLILLVVTLWKLLASVGCLIYPSSRKQAKRYNFFSIFLTSTEL